MSNKDLELTLNMHVRGINHVRKLLERSGFAILAVNKDLDSPSQLLAKVGDRSLLIAVRTACHPDAEILDEEIREQLIEESEKLNAVPYFAGIIIAPINGADIHAEDIAGGSEYKVIFNGMTVIS